MQATISRDEARQKVAQVLLARQNIALFSEFVQPWYSSYRMHHMIANELNEVIRYLRTGKGTQFLMILTPPQHGKSAEVSRNFPAFALGVMPNLRITQVSYGADLASANSRAVRNIVMSAEYQLVFGERSSTEEPVMLSSDSRSVSAWDLAAPHRGGMVAAGVGGAITGRPRGLFIIDDPIKDHREAQSQDVRDDVWDFYLSSVRVRAMAIVLIMTHWHPDDLAGRLMRAMVSDPSKDQWRILSLPLLALDRGEYPQTVEEQRKRMLEGVYVPMSDPLGRTAGEVLCPEMLTLKEALKIRATQDDYFFMGLYQQMPFSREGQLFKREWFRTVKALPEGVKLVLIVRYWDKASSPTGDYSAGVLEGYGSDGNYYILDVARGRWTSFERDAQMAKIEAKDWERWGKLQTWHQQDPGSAGRDSAEATNRKLKLGFFETVSGSKVDRSDPLRSDMQSGLVFLLQGGWNEAFIDECVAFDRGKYDDQVDSGSSAHNKVKQMIGRQRESRIL